MEFYTQYSNIPMKNDKLGGKRITEIGTYVPSDKLIKSFINAGRVIEGARQVVYDFPDDIDDGRAPDPTRRPDFDLADFTRLQRQLMESLSEQNKSSDSEKAEISEHKEESVKTNSELSSENVATESISK